MKKYIVLFLLCGFFGNAQYNLFARQNFANKTVSTSTNTEIGGVASTISTPALLATKLAIDVSRITNFSIVGSDIKCKITGGHGSGAWNNDTSLTYYIDSDNLITTISQSVFNGCTNLYKLDLKGVIYIERYAFRNTKLTELYFPNLTSTDISAFDEMPNYAKYIYIPNCTNLGGTAINNGVFAYCLISKIYANPSLETNNGGAPDGDLIGNNVGYVNNFTSPNPVTTLADGTIYNTAIQLNFTAPTGSTNAIDFYECYADGVFKNKVTASGQYISGLSAATSYNITVIAVDIFYNKSVVSNSLSVSTTSNISDADATAYTTASSNSAYQYAINDLFKVLKDNSLYTKVQAFYPFLGTTAAQHKWNAKNPLDTDAAFRLTFTGAATFSNNGYQLNGSSYANTYFVPSAQQTVNSNGITVVVGTNNAAAGSDVVEIGTYNSVTQKSYIIVKNNNSNFNRIAGFNSNNAIQGGVNESRGVFTGTKQSSTVTDLFVNGVQTATASGGGTLPTVNMYIGCLNLSGIPYGHSNQRLQIVLFHEGLSDGEVVTLHTIIDIFEAALGRKTW